MHDQPNPQLRAEVRELCARFGGDYWRARDAAREYPQAFVEALTASGLLAALIPPQYGGLGLGLADASIVLEEINRSGGSAAACHAQMYTMGALLRHGSEEQKREYLPRIASGELRLQAFSVTEAEAGSDTTSIATTARRDGDEYVITGSKTFITNGPRADFILLVAKTDPDARHEGITLFLVDLRDDDGNHVSGFEISRRLEKMGMHASDTGELAFKEVRVPSDAVLGEIGKGFYHISWELQGERLVAAAGCHAGAERMFEKTLAYAKEREAFGRPIGRFQAIRHKFAEMATKIEVSRALTYACLRKFAAGEDPVREITEAKLFASRVACEVADECVQILGGYGYMKEYEIERAYRDVRLNRIGAGTDEIMLDVIGRSYGL